MTGYDADVLVNQGRALVDYYLDLAVRCGNGKTAANWVQQDVLRALKERELSIDAFPISSEQLAELLQAIQQGDLPGNRGREVFETMLDEGVSSAAAMQSLGIEKVDQGALETLCQEIIDANPKIVADVKNGQTKAAGAFIGQAKKKNPNIDPRQVKEICLALIEKM